jgi:hypothetical protein
MKTRTQSTQAALKRRIRQFYKLFNQREFERCFQMIDPRVRHRPASVTLDQYANSLRDFIDHVGTSRILEVSFDLHRREPSTLYENRDFALGKTVWEDRAGQKHVFSERWVREGKSWYTRSTGFVIPGAAEPRRKRA